MEIGIGAGLVEGNVFKLVNEAVRKDAVQTHEVFFRQTERGQQTTQRLYDIQPVEPVFFCAGEWNSRDMQYQFGAGILLHKGEIFGSQKIKKHAPALVQKVDFQQVILPGQFQAGLQTDHRHPAAFIGRRCGFEEAGRDRSSGAAIKRQCVCIGESTSVGVENHVCISVSVR